MTKKIRLLTLVGLLFSLLFLMRIIHLSADPPPDLSSSMGYMSDPGGYVFNARNKIVFDAWEMDMWNIRHISPLPHYFSYMVFVLFGVGIAQMNMVPVFFSCLVLVVGYWLMRKNYPIPLVFLGTWPREPYSDLIIHDRC